MSSRVYALSPVRAHSAAGPARRAGAPSRLSPLPRHRRARIGRRMRRAGFAAIVAFALVGALVQAAQASF